MPGSGFGFRINERLLLEVRHCALGGPASIMYVQRYKKQTSAEYEPVYIYPSMGVQLRN